MAKVGEAELKNQIKSGDFSNVYMIYGEEDYLKEYYVNKLKDKLVEPAFADFNFHQYDGKKTPVSEILNDADMMPMMAQYSLLLVVDYPFDKSKDDVEKVKTYLKDINPSSVVVFLFNQIDVNAKFKTLENAIAKAGTVVNLEKRTEGELAKLIISSAKKRKCTIDTANAKYMISLVGNDIKTVFNELEKMCSFVGEGEITRKSLTIWLLNAFRQECLICQSLSLQATVTVLMRYSVSFLHKRKNLSQYCPSFRLVI